MLQERLTRTLLGDLRGMGEYVFEVSVFLHELTRRFVSDATNARNVIGRIAYECQVVRDEFGRHTQPLFGILNANPMFLNVGWTTATRVQQPHSGLNELLEILVTGNDHDIDARVDTPGHQSSYYIVRLIPGKRQNWNAIRIEHFADTVHSPIEIRL